MKVIWPQAFATQKTPESHRPTPPPVAQPENPQVEWDRHLASAADAVYAKHLWMTEQWLIVNGATQVKSFDCGFTQAVGYVREGHRCLVVRGSQQKQDFLMDGLCFYWGTPAIHYGFLSGWSRIAKDVRVWLQEARAPNPGVYLAGHSLGAAVAAVAAVDLARSGLPIEGVVLFGCPRVGAPEFAASYRQHGLVPKTRRFVHGLDGVCVIPPPLAYTHVAPPIKLDSCDKLIPVTGQSSAMSATVWNAALQALIALFPRSANSGLIMLPYLAHENPNSRWFNPDLTPLGKYSTLAGYASFFLVVAAAWVLFSIGDLSAWLMAHAGANTLLFWITAALEAFLLQQTVFFLLFFLPSKPRLLTSVAVVAVLFWFLPIVRIETITIPILVTLGGLLLLMLYNFGSGAPDHLMNCYLDALRAKPGRAAAEKLADMGATAPLPPNWKSLGLGLPRRDSATQKEKAGGKKEGV